MKSFKELIESGFVHQLTSYLPANEGTWYTESIRPSEGEPANEAAGICKHNHLVPTPATHPLPQGPIPHQSLRPCSSPTYIPSDAYMNYIITISGLR